MAEGARSVQAGLWHRRSANLAAIGERRQSLAAVARGNSLWTGGNFQLDFEGKTDKETTQLNTQGLLMEGLRLLDESQRDSGAETSEVANASSAPGGVTGGGGREEEEDVLLDS